jgi:hypothetical protein
MKSLFSISVLTLAAMAPAQATASTLLRLSHASTIAEVKVLAVQVDHQVRQVVFKTLHALKGSPPRTFTLQEADARMCGSALHGLVPGIGLLAFLDHGAQGTKLALPSPRALAPLNPEIRAHVLALLKVGTGSPVQLLTKALSAHDPRVRQDAAYALPLLRDLPQADPADRTRILASLRLALAGHEKRTASLIHTAQRLRLSAAVDSLLPHYLAATRPDLEPLLVNAIADIDAGAAVRNLARAMPVRRQQQRRAVQLLARCSGRDATACLQELLTARDHGVQTHAAAALLEDGHSAEDIRKQAGARVLDAGRLLLEHKQKHKNLRFRSIRFGKDD